MKNLDFLRKIGAAVEVEIENSASAKWRYMQDLIKSDDINSIKRLKNIKLGAQNFAICGLEFDLLSFAVMHGAVKCALHFLAEGADPYRVQQDTTAIEWGFYTGEQALVWEMLKKIRKVRNKTVLTVFSHCHLPDDKRLLYGNLHKLVALWQDDESVTEIKIRIDALTTAKIKLSTIAELRYRVEVPGFVSHRRERKKLVERFLAEHIV
jgi:hypothetical protein